MAIAIVKPIFCVVLPDGEKWSVEADRRFCRKVLAGARRLVQASTSAMPGRFRSGLTSSMCPIANWARTRLTFAGTVGEPGGLAGRSLSKGRPPSDIARAGKRTSKDGKLCCRSQHRPPDVDIRTINITAGHWS